MGAMQSRAGVLLSVALAVACSKKDAGQGSGGRSRSTALVKVGLVTDIGGRGGTWGGGELIPQRPPPGGGGGGGGGKRVARAGGGGTPPPRKSRRPFRRSWPIFNRRLNSCRSLPWCCRARPRRTTNPISSCSS